MASMNFSAGKQFVKPPQRGIFPLDHDAECKTKMKVRVVSWALDTAQSRCGVVESRLDISDQ